MVFITISGWPMPVMSGNQLAAARRLIEMEQRELAAAAGVALNTIRRIEQSGSAVPVPARTETLKKLEDALAVAGVELTNGDNPGVRLSQRNEG